MRKDDLISRLPYPFGEMTLRLFTRKDVDLRAGWPSYPEDFASFNCTWGALDTTQRDELFSKRMSDKRSLVMSIDHPTQPCIAYIALHEIDWVAGFAENLGVRLHPDWCGKGIGTEIMRGFVRWCFASGLNRLRHDVCALNPRAVRCYEKVGYHITGEFWNDDPSPKEMIPDGVNLQVVDGMTQVRFFWMEIERKD